MKILAIRGENIASLEAFDVDLSQGTLGQVGLFAITGPTGAGKSTILDALCLALFDKTPRLQDRSTVRPGRTGQDEDQRLTSTDSRNLLKKGTAFGFAEVDFVGGDGGRYRARWEVRRARLHADGRIQPQSQTLRDLAKDVDLSDGRRTETLRQIQALLGLDFDQFRRSALLAQGDFAAFLRANEGERAELLEAMTGTAIYGRLGKAAYDRARLERDQLGKLNAQLDGVALLSAEQREALTQEQAAAGVAQAAAAAALEAARLALAWHQRQAELNAGVQAAEAALWAAEAAWKEAEAERGHIAEYQLAEPLRPALSAAEHAQQARIAAQDRLERLQQERREALATSTAALAAESQAAASRLVAEQARLGAAPDLDAAAVLDTRLVDARRDHEAAEAAQKAAQTSLQQAEAARKRAQEAQDGAAAAVASAQAWMNENSHQQRMVEEWPELRPRLHALVGVHAERRQLQARVNAQSTAEAAAEAALPPLVEEQQTREAAVVQIEFGAAAAEGAAAEAPVKPAEARWSAAQDNSRDLQQLRDRLLEGQRLRASVTELAATLAQLQHDQQTAQAAAVALAEDEQRLKAETLTAQGVEAGLRLALDVSVHRDALVPGEACPLCGSPEHPWADAPAPVEAKLAEAGQRLSALRGQLTQVQGAQARASGQAAVARAEAEKLATQRAAQQGREQLAVEACQPLCRALSIQGENGDLEAILAEVEQRFQAAATEVLVARAALQQARDLGEAARVQGATLAQARRDLQAAIDRLTAARGQRDAQVAAGQTLRGELLTLDSQIAGRLEALSGPLSWHADWQEALLAEDPARSQALLARWDAVVAAHRAHQGALEAAVQALTAAQAALQPARDAFTRADAEAQAAALALSPRLDALKALATQRAALLGGEATATVRARLEAALAAADSTLTGARLGREGAEKLLAQAEARCTEAEARREEAQKAEAQRVQDRDTALAAAGLSLAAVTATLARGQAWLAAALDRRDAARDARQQADSVHKERKVQLRAHLENEPAEIILEEDDPTLVPSARAQARLLRAQTQSQQQNEAVAALKTQLAADAANRQRSEGLLAQVTTQAAVVQRWDSMAELIGSADGKKLRVFAQSLTLEALVSETNHHLKTLARRYRLERVDGSNLDLQIIDLEMAEEVRGVNSLSGGESFLVSLGLALGLAGLSARDTSVETLFIDEGFGSLDEGSLATAMETLESLQAQGRQVGLISHVPGLAEKIGAQVQVLPRGGGRSVVRVLAR